MNIYLIGAMTYWDKQGKFEEKAVKWREYIISRLATHGFKCFNPTVFYIINKKYSGNLIVAQNDVYINNCDAAIVNTEAIEYSPGSIYELTRFKELRKPVFAFGGKVEQPHINSCITEYFNTMDNIIDCLIAMFCQKSCLK